MRAARRAARPDPLPDRMLWMPRIVLAYIGWQTCGVHPARRQSCSYGQERIAGQAHVIWRRIGTHGIFTPPPGP
jgi:hypothetical protein